MEKANADGAGLADKPRVAAKTCTMLPSFDAEDGHKSSQPALVQTARDNKARPGTALSKRIKAANRNTVKWGKYMAATETERQESIVFSHS